jgi:large subunit ribosomal protein L9
MALKVLLLEDVDNLGRSGDVVQVKPGFARNFLLPKRRALYADAHTLRLQEKLQEERAKKSAEDKKDAEKQATLLKTITLSVTVKIDKNEHMYGSVSSLDILHMLEEKGVEGLSKKSVILAHAIKQLGVYTVALRLKEGVESEVIVKVMGEGLVEKPKAQKEEQSEVEEEVEASEETEA